ncbi:MAG: CCA tRNA nucleotidyltransferase [Azospirillum brasilense]|nr:MAG: CCA tRNA nucleotidyltransferase [Azospirillum brasilense]
MITPLWLDEPALQQWFAAVEARGGEARAVGGCVRDHVLGRRSNDVDMACTLVPPMVMDIAHQLGWKAVPTGIAHGTVTLVLPNRVLEVTTLRRDVKTDGRHAEVLYTTRFEDDAARRDFTMNALYMDRTGQITDFHEGVADAQAGRVRFIGDAHARIREDGLRILRFFRFLATHGTPPADAEALSACAGLRAMLDDLSGERIQQEMKKLLMAPDPTYALVQMSVLALGEVLCGSAWQVGLLQPVLQREAQHKLPPSPWVRLLALVVPAQRMAVAQQISSRWKLSRADMQVLEFLTAPPPLQQGAQVKEALRHFKREWVQQSLLLHAADDPDFMLQSVLPLARSWEPPVFPVTAHDLMARGMVQGRELGDALRAIEQRWVQSDYRLSRQELLAQ